MDVIISESAQAEILHAARYYEDEVEGLGKTFVTYVERSIAEIEDFPMASRIVRRDFRRLLVPRFPFGVIYRVDKNKIFVAAIMHLKREPFYWDQNQS